MFRSTPDLNWSLQHSGMAMGGSGYPGVGPRSCAFSFFGLEKLAALVQGALAAQVATPGGGLGTCSGP